MSFRLFIYYCALCGAWAAFLTWGAVQGIGNVRGLLLRAAMIAGLLGAFVAAGVGLIDAGQNGSAAQRLLRVLVSSLLGLVGGALGGFVGQVLNTFEGLPAAVGAALVVVGWVITGVLIGASIGAYDLLLAATAGRERPSAVRKTLHGVYGGLIGGLIGGLPFTLLAGNTTLPRSGQLVSLVLLGGSIGLMIGLAQVILKEGWVKVEEGFRPGRELSLNKEETTIGRAEGCDLGLFADNGVEKVHARILRKNSRYLLAHAAEAGQTLLNDRPVGGRPEPLRAGDRIKIGKCVLRFGERQRKPKT